MEFVERIFGEFKSQKSRWLIVGVLVVGAILRLWVSWQPVEILIGKNLPDDAYYYFVLARNTIQLGSASMDGVNVTNGFHPLWWIIITPIFGWSSTTSDLQINLALTLASSLDLVSIWIVGQLAAFFTRRESLGILAAWLYAANPIVILQITNGLETAIGIFTLTVFLLLVKLWLTGAPNWRFAIIVGISGGFMFLARSDSIFLFGLALLAAIWFWRDIEGFWRVILAGAAALLVVSPWFTWSRIVVGTWLQESGFAVPYAIHVRVAMEQGTGLLVVLSESLRQLFYPAIWLRGDFSGLPLFIGIGIWFLLVAGLVKRWRRSAVRIEKAIFLPLLGSGLALVIAHAGLRWYPRPWYFIPCSVAFALTFVLVGKSFLDKPRAVFLATLAFTVYFVLSGYMFWRIGYFPWQRETLAANDWLAENIPHESSVASFNSGIYTYYNDFRVINLDGVVNHQAYEAVQKHKVLAYLQRNQVDFLIDYDLAIWREYAPFMGEGFPDSLEEVAILSERRDGNLGLLRIYQVDR